MKALLLAAGAALFVTACTTTTDDDLIAAEAPMQGMPATTYMEGAASGDMFEIQSGQLASQRSCDPTVRSFGQMLVADHTRMTNQMLETARANRLPPPPMQLLPHHMDMLERLRSAPAGAFEAEFKNGQVAAHQESLSLHRTYADTGDHNALRAVASQAIPAVEMHLRQAQNLPTSCAFTPPVEQQLRRGERG